MKRYKPLLLQIGLLLLLVSLVVFILEHQKKYITVDFSKQYSSNKTIELAGFEEGEQWSGNYSYDSQRVAEGKGSIIFSSWYGVANSITHEEVVNLTQGYSKGYLSLLVSDKKNVSAVESFQLVLSSSANAEKKYDLTPYLHEGWNRIPVSIPDWKSITRISFVLTSKKGEIAEINLDRFWIENTSVYTSDIIASKSQSVSLRTIGERTYIFVASPKEESVTFISPEFIKQGVITISLIPEHAKSMALTLNGTTMHIDGKNMSQCILYKNRTDVTEKIFQTTSASNNLYVFMKAEIKNNSVTFSLSNNGIDFEQCGEVKSTEKKPIQLTLDGSYLIDSYSVEY